MLYYRKIKQQGGSTLAKQEFLNFKEISSSIKFNDVLDWLNIPYENTGKELRGEGFIITIEKNLFFSPEDDSVKGSVINFVCHIKHIEVREAASLLKAQFLSKIQPKPKRDIPNLILHYDEYLSKRGIDPNIAKEYEVGLVKDRSIVSGRIVFKMYDHDSNHIGYIGYKVNDQNWFTPKGLKRPLYNLHKHLQASSIIVTVDPFDALRIISLGITPVVSLLANSMTVEQENRLKKFKKILLLHKEPANIVNRIYNSCYVKAPVLSKSLQEMSNNELTEIISPSK